MTRSASAQQQATDDVPWRFRAQHNQVAEARRRSQIVQFGAPCPEGGALRIARSSRASGWKGSGRQDRLACRAFSVH
jgi:hypothetical protein